MSHLSKKVLILVLTFIVTVTLASCNSKSVTIPYGSLGDDIYVSAGDYSVTKKTLYNKMHSNAYSLVEESILRQIDASLIKDAVDGYASQSDEDKAVFNYKEEFDSQVFNAIYSSTDVETIAKSSDFEKETYLKKYASNMLSNYGITVDTSLIEFDFTAEIPTALKPLPSNIINYYSLYIAEKAKALRDLSESMDEEKIDGVSNEDYLAENNYRVAYATYSEKFFNTTGIIVKFNSLADANAAITKATNEVGELNDSNVSDFYINLYNNYYSYRTPLTSADLTIVTDDDTEANSFTHFQYDLDSDDLSKIGTNLKALYVDGLEDGEYLSSPRSTDGTYTMVYKNSTKYIYGGKNTETKFDDLNETDLAKAKKDIKDIVLQGRVSDSFIQSHTAETFENLDITFYDSIIRSQYINANDSHYDNGYDKDLSTASTDLIYKMNYDGKTYELKVDDLFNSLEAIYGIDSSMELLTNQYLIDNYLDTWLTDEDKADLDEQFETVISNYKAGSIDGYSTDLGVENFKSIYFGFNSDEQIKEQYYYAASLRTIYTTKTYYYADYYKDLASNSKFNEESNLFTNLKQFNDLSTEQQFSLDVVHMLISVDDEVDGTLDDPAEFRASLANEQAREDYDNAVMALVNAIVAETNAIDATKKEAFNYIVTAYNNDLPLTAGGDYAGKTWADFKSIYHFSLKTEDLGTINTGNAGQYVYPFSSHAKTLFNDIKDSFDEENGYLEFSDAPLTNINDLCTTNYGYHVFDVTDLDASTNSAKFTIDDDRYVSGEEGPKVYEAINVNVDTYSDDPTEIIANGYSDTDEASTNQLFVYFFESQTTDGVTSLYSRVESSIDDTFSSISTRFLSSEFQTYKLMNDLKGTSSDLASAIKFASDDESKDAALNIYLQNKRDTIDGYVNPNETIGYIFDDWFNLDWNN